MKKHGFLCVLLAFLLLCLPITAVESPLTFCDAKTTPDLSGGGYPRFARLQNGKLLLVNAASANISANGGKTFTRYTIACSKSVVSPTGKTHTLARSNFQPYVLPDGTVLMAYRAHTANYTAAPGAEFYTSIRVLVGSADGTKYGDEQILIEDVCDGKFYGFWEPFMIQIDEDTVALYYSDDLNVDNASYQQNINYLTYSISEKKWDTTIRTAINGVRRGSRDGMPAVVKLIDGSFAMTIEAFDYHSRNGSYNSPFVVSLARSKDGLNWDLPVPVVAPTNLKGGYTCCAPFIAALPDGRVVISYMTTEDYVGSNSGPSGSYNCVFGMAISDAPLTYDTKLTPSKGGAAKGFTKLESPFGKTENGYQIWNTVYYSDGELYAAGGAGLNEKDGKTVGIGNVIRRADIPLPMETADLDGDGTVSFADVLFCLRHMQGKKRIDLGAEKTVGTMQRIPGAIRFALNNGMKFFDKYYAKQIGGQS